MKRLDFKKGTFTSSVFSINDLAHIKGDRPEIAIAGKSNVGKSSFINHLLKQKGIAKVSSTPGKTQCMNFFFIDDEIFLVDLPGYGFAKVPKALKINWATSIDTYLNQRKTLKLTLLLIDLRHLPTQEDLHFLSWAKSKNKPLLAVFTKADKLSPYQQTAQLEKNLNFIQEKTGFYALHHIPYSIKFPHCREHLIIKINTLLWGL